MDLWRFFGDCLRKSTNNPFFQHVDVAREMDISRGMSICPLQDSLRFRARFIALEIAEALIDEKGALQLEILQGLVEQLRVGRFFIAPYLENDVFLFEHLFNSLQFLAQNGKSKGLLGRFSAPVCHKAAERLVRDTLWPRKIKVVSDADVKKAVLAAWFTWLRQTTGSCFATAPAILIQQQQPLLLLQDLFDLMTFGSLKRVVAGQEFSVPLCPSLEMADLLRPLAPYSELSLSYAPGLRAAFAAAGLQMERVRKIEGAYTVKALIEKTVLLALDLDEEAVAAELRLSRLEMNALLAKNSAVYYQKPSARALKVAEWKEKTALACTAYQALGDCALVRAWESTLASFSDVKVDVGRWNLYVSLGMNSEQPGGVGAFLFERINWYLQKINAEMVALQADHQHASSLARNAERQQLRQEYTTAMFTVNALVEKSKQLSEEGEMLSKLFSQMMQGYDKLIPESFQEVFDPSLATDLNEMIDDSPAGFRLAYKHGRTASSQWTFIRTSEGFVDAIREFFGYAERELAAQYPKQRTLIEALSTELMQLIQTAEFSAGALTRVKQNPTMQGGISKPWEYISGGTMTGLVMTYFNRSEPFTTVERKIQSEEELLALLLDCKKNSQMALMHSPTHAFIYRPDFLPDDVPQELVAMRQFWQGVVLRDELWLAEAFTTILSENERALFIHQWKQKNRDGTLISFRAALIASLSKMRADPESFVDAFLYESLPLIDAKHASILAQELVGPCVPFFSDQKYFTPTLFRERVKAATLTGLPSPLAATDLDEEIAQLLRKNGLASPKPLLFADTNWSAGFFGLAISPAGTFDLWRFNRTGMSGTPMRQWFDLQRNGVWIVLSKPEEYTG